MDEKEFTPEELIKGWNLVSRRMEDNLTRLREFHPSEGINQWTYRESLFIQLLSEDDRYKFTDIKDENSWFMEYQPQPGPNHINVVLLMGYDMYFYFIFSGLLTFPKVDDMIFSKTFHMGHYEVEQEDKYINTRLFFWQTACLRYMIKNRVYQDVLEVMLNAGKNREEAIKRIPWMLEESRKGNLPRIDDIKTQCKLLEIDIKKFKRLREDKKLITKTKTDLRKIHPHPSPIIFVEEASQEEIITQMCIWALRQGQEENELLKTYIFKYLIKFLQKHMNIKKEDIESYAWDTYEALMKNWKAPLSKGSFRIYLKNTIRGLKLNEVKKRSDLVVEGDKLEILFESKKNDKLGNKGNKLINYFTFPLTIREAAKLFYYYENLYAQDVENFSLDVLIRWIYRQIVNGKIINVGQSYEQITQEGFIQTINQYLIDKEGYETLKYLWKTEGCVARSLRSRIINSKAEEMGWTIRYTRKWIYKQIEINQPVQVDGIAELQVRELFKNYVSPLN
ncbi:hypothetical protein [Atribacter laminatus]|uniref:Uncharacterized protein n=1 Tax=Atribacter laminatus TaxID=2847778 RepID=A0A7T1AMY5_ATRLM|nr:hypothetical protein [Atribacter laminatus]QPM68862.1 hypothetical protein RT761_02089 [Atribacter laminatus]